MNFFPSFSESKSGFRIAFNMFDTDGNQIVDKKEFLVVRIIRRWLAVYWYLPYQMSRVRLICGSKKKILKACILMFPVNLHWFLVE